MYFRYRKDYDKVGCSLRQSLMEKADCNSVACNFVTNVEQASQGQVPVRYEAEILSCFLAIHIQSLSMQTLT